MRSHSWGNPYANIAGSSERALGRESSEGAIASTVRKVLLTLAMKQIDDFSSGISMRHRAAPCISPLDGQAPNSAGNSGVLRTCGATREGTTEAAGCELFGAPAYAVGAAGRSELELLSQAFPLCASAWLPVAVGWLPALLLCPPEAILLSVANVRRC